MITISLCIIVKNEERTLSACLDCLTDIVDEIIIVDTGSTDQTKAIASRYTSQIYDYEWNNNFADARNFSFSKATMDYIYAPDADEILDEENRQRFLSLKKLLMPEIEIVQMYYREQGLQTILNVQRELRPKLFKRLRTFTWIDPIHETIRTAPVVFNSDIEILHCPQDSHSKRDFSIFEHAYETHHQLSPSLLSMYAKELLKCGDSVDLANASHIFEELITQGCLSPDTEKKLSCALARYYRISKQSAGFLKVTTKDMAATPCSEICCELGEYFYALKDYREASLWFYSAAYEVEAILDIHSQGDIPRSRLADSYDRIADSATDAETISTYQKLAADTRVEADSWTIPLE